jgi:hypothetical protein
MQEDNGLTIRGPSFIIGYVENVRFYITEGLKSQDKIRVGSIDIC